MTNEENSLGIDVPATEKFDCDPRDLACRCGCGYNSASPRLIELLNKLSGNIRERLIINSGCRCPEHNFKEKGAPKSFHLTGEAVDVKSQKMDALTLAIAGFNAGFTGIIVYKTFVHLDVRKRCFMELNVHLFDTPEEKVSDEKK
jgi:hypothetical protein